MAKVENKWLRNAPLSAPTEEVPVGVINGTNKDFVLSKNPNKFFVFVNSLKEEAYTYNSGTKTISLVTAPELGQNIKVILF